MLHNLNKKNRPVLKISPTPMNRVFDILAIAGLVIMFIVVLKYFSALPDRVPVDFNIFGKVHRVRLNINIAGKGDGWVSKYTFCYFPILGLIIYILLTALSRFPQTYNYPWPITEKNAAQQYRLAIDLMSRLKVIAIGLYTFLTIQGIRVALGTASGLGVAFSPIFSLILLGTICLYFWQAYQAR